ncbi:hypothetical protein MASR2M66_10220 [Chloroflexota bacterium]
MPKKQNSKKRVEDLFSGIHDIITGPSNGQETAHLETPRQTAEEDANPLQQQVAALKARVRELETRLKERGNRPAAAPLIYEKEEIGFAFSGDEVVAVRGTRQPVPNEAEFIKSPLTSSGKHIGEVKVANPPERALNDEDIKLANAIAQQASLQIENLRLLAAAERARVEAEEASKQYAHVSWENFLDAINNAERIGYMYDQAVVEPFNQLKPEVYDHEAIMQTLNMQIGKLFIKGNQALTEDDKLFIGAIANQVGQQVENIRLLADASRARAEAEEATRRLTRENWETYTEREGNSLGFMYDSVKVSPLDNSAMAHQAVFTQPLYVRGEAIGQLAIAGLENMPPEAKELTAAVAAQTSIHLETLRLTEELQKRAQELKELDRLKSAFLANMSHELRTPLNSILGFTDVMLEGLDGELTAYMDNDLRLIQKNGQHLLYLINDVLDMAKIESGRMNLHLEKIRVHSLLDEVINITSTLANEKDLALIIEPDSDTSLEVYADNTRLRQVMLNLVNNSIKFTNKGSVTIQAKILDDAKALITVKDTGLGIPPDKLEAVFLEFTQVDTSSTRKVGGTGLGLPISRRLVEMHGGRLWAESTGTDGEGCIFFVELPLKARIIEVIEGKTKQKGVK